jgi:hypothetical protein
LYNYDNKAWLTAGIRISCQHKRNLYIHCRSIESPTLLVYYKKYNKILREVMKAAKRIYYNKLIVNSDNKTKTIWNIGNNEIGKHNSNHDLPPLIKEGKKISSGLHIANVFNVHFNTILDNRFNGPHINSGSNVSKNKFFHYLTTVTIGPISEHKYICL